MEEVNNETNETIEMEDKEQIEEVNLNLASRWKRLGGAIIDSVISGIIGFHIHGSNGYTQKTV